MRSRCAIRWSGSLLMAGALLAAVPATAQNVLSAPQQVQACLCLEQGTSNLATDVATHKQTYEQRRQELDQLNAQLASLKQRMNVDNPADVAAYAQLFDKRNAAFDTFSRDVEPQYAASVERYNRMVADYNNSCVNKSYDAAVLATVKPTLSCPPP
jgi:septal ring factor EnvC (AmiA/AmiB activator)